MFGEALKQSRALGQTTYGIAGGFEKTMPKASKRGARAGPSTAEDGDDEEDEDMDDDNDDDEGDKDKTSTGLPGFDVNIEKYVNNFDDANNKGHVLNKITWSGRIIGREPWKPNYFIGSFRDNELHLTRVAGIVQLYPEVQHFDAIDHLEAVSKHRAAKTAKDVVAGPSKKSITGEPTVEELLNRGAQEPWVKMRWNHSEANESWDAYNKRFFLEDTVNAPLVTYESSAEYVERVLPRVVGRAPPVQKRD